MGRALRVITGHATNPGTTFTPATPNSGDRLSVDNFDVNRGAYLVALWSNGATAGYVRVRSNRLHDNSQALRFFNGTGAPYLLFFAPYAQRLYPGDTLTVELTGGATETDSFGMLWTYEDLPGADARFADWASIANRIKHYVTCEVAAPNPTVAGDYGATVAINTAYDVLRANTDYALLGYTVSAAVTAVAIVGPDLSNLRVGGPGEANNLQTYDFFVRLSERLGAPYIPIINANNKGNTLVQIANNATTGSVTVNLIFAELE